MRRHRYLTWLIILGAAAHSAALLPAVAQPPPAPAAFDETPQTRDARMAWWREARFGMFIHWGLYAIPAGRWEGRPVGGVGEWLMQFARIPPSRYETLAGQFNPVKFDADAWARLASDAGMKYLVITTKHHDGFALFDSAVSDYDITATPFKRDIMKELAVACRAHGIRIGWYHSILDWHHPDYLPKPDWSDQPPEAADYQRYKEYLFAQVREILTNYGPIDIMWFDGEWDPTWTREDGLALDALVRELQPDIIVNNRVGKQRYAGEGVPEGARFAGDFGTPEQEIPATGLPGQDWETCMTMNDTWGFKEEDHNWKSTDDLIRKLIDIASKGGNFLLNVGPTSEGFIPEASVMRLRAMGDWLAINGEAIYGTQASPFEHLEWGRCTMRRLENGDTRLYLHVFDWPGGGGRLRLPGIANQPLRAAILTADGREPMSTWRGDDAIFIAVPARPPVNFATVIALEVSGGPDVCPPPRIVAVTTRFVDAVEVRIESDRPDVIANYHLRGMNEWAVAAGPLTITKTTMVRAMHFRDGRAVSGVREVLFTRVEPRPAVDDAGAEPGVSYEYFEADSNTVADLLRHEPVASGIALALDIGLRRREEHYGFRFRGLIRVPRDGMYRFTLSSDDGATLRIGDELVVDHDGLHAAYEKHGDIALAAGLHPFEVLFFEKGGDEALDLWVEGLNLTGLVDSPGAERRRVDAAMMFLPAPVR